MLLITFTEQLITQPICCNCSPFYRRKSSESASLPTGVTPQLTEAYDERSHANVDGLAQTVTDKHQEWLNEDQSSLVTVDSVTEVIAAVDSCVHGHPSLSSSSSLHDSATDSLTSSVAANSVPNNGTLLWDCNVLPVHEYLQCTTTWCIF